MSTSIENSADTSPSAFATLISAFSEPSKAFDAVVQRSMVWLPLLSIIGASLLLIVWYYQTVDIGWLQDRLTATVTDPVAREGAKGFMKRSTLTSIGAVGVLVAVPAMFAITALYFSIVAKIKKLEFGFGKWFAFVVWASVPTLLTLPLGGLQILLANNGQLEPGQLNPVSLNSLIFHIGTGLRWASLMDSISLITLWTMLLTVIGYQRWSKASRASSIAVVVIPYALIYGIWAAVSLMSKAA